MSDSLREQMLQAGFKESPTSNNKKSTGKSKKPRRAGSNAQGHAKKHTSEPSSMERANIAERAAVAERKRIKAEIKSIIEASKIEETKGEHAHSYVVGKRIKQMFVNDKVREQLVAGTLVITRLNGATFLIPIEAGERVCALNPDWVVITPASEHASDADDDYADFQVPDDLTW